MKRIIFNCEECGREVNLSIYDKSKNFDKYKRDLCRSCRLKLQYKAGLRQKCIERCKLNAANQKGKSYSEMYSEEKVNEIKSKLSKASSGENNPMFGDHEHTKGLKAYNASRQGVSWEDFYGKELSDKMKKQMSEKMSGEKNHMFGKPSPVGSGNGWSGWYKHFYFRSLLELSFLVEHQNAENAEHIKIHYIDFDGKERTYHPDFIEDNKLYEIKPQNLVDTATNKLKFEAAKKYCEENMLIFIIETENSIQKLSDEEIKILHDNNEIKFTERYEEKYRRRSQ